MERLAELEARSVYILREAYNRIETLVMLWSLGKRHNQAIRALGRHICRVIFKMLSQERPYWIDP